MNRTYPGTIRAVRTRIDAVPNNSPKPTSNTRAAGIEPRTILLAENNTAYPRNTTDEQAINALYRNQISHIEASSGKATA